jgi:DNA-binding NarL/FixJ family response regulator
VSTRVVIADDSEPFLELLRAVLGHMPEVEVVGAAADGREAVRLAVEQDADVALLDVEMPVLDGFAAAEAIRRTHPRTKLLLHTASMVEERRRHGAELNLRVFDKLKFSQTVELVVSARETAAPWA